MIKALSRTEGHTRNLKTLRADLCHSVQMNRTDTNDLPWSLVEHLAYDYYASIPMRLAAKIHQAIKERDALSYMELQKYNDPTLYGSPQAYLAATSVLSFLKKYPFGRQPGLDPEAEAIRKFETAEMQCRITNKRLLWYRSRGYRLDRKLPGVYSILHAARLKIAAWLGPLDLNKIYDYARHGPGGSIYVTGSKTTYYYKYAADCYSVSPAAKPYAIAGILADPAWRRYVFSGETFGGDAPPPSTCREAVEDRLELANYNKIAFVPKTAKTHRAIAVEPTMNLYFQLGVGGVLRDTLRTHGCDLNSQLKNQHLARLGSRWLWDASDRPVTLDLSSASDTLSIELVRELLPDDWFIHMDALRSKNGQLGSMYIPWAKFSSMGNGFTFELESMIFYALALSVLDECGGSKSSLSVYGDDIIVPANCALRLCEVLRHVGFSLNREKSYVFGPFRESCGSDYFEGVDVRPFFLKRELKRNRDLLHVANSFSPVDGSFWSEVVSLLPKDIRRHLLGPRSEDLDGHLHVSWDYAQRSALVLWDRDLQTMMHPSVKDSPVQYDARSSGAQTLQVLSGLRLRREDRQRGLNTLRYQLAIADIYADVVALSAITRRKSTRVSLNLRPVTGGWARLQVG